MGHNTHAQQKVGWGGVGVCASLVVAGTLSGHDATVLLPALPDGQSGAKCGTLPGNCGGPSPLLPADYSGMRH